MNGVYQNVDSTRATVFDEIATAAADLLGAVGELAKLEWTESSSSLVDLALSVADRVEELRRLSDAEQPMTRPKNVVAFRARGGAS